ncbi:MAG: hypothetical protein ACFCD0_05735 [Gemmataceae bacterium]
MIDRRYGIGFCVLLLVIGVSCAPTGNPKGEVPRNAPSRGPVGMLPQQEASPMANPQPQQPRLPNAAKARIEAAITVVEERDLLTSHSFWTVIHGILANGLDVALRDASTGKQYKAMDHIRQGKYIRGLRFIPTGTGVDVQMGPTFEGQGHQDQFVGEIAQCGLSLDTTFQINGQEYLFKDFIDHTKARARVNADQELSWTLVAVSQYEGTDCSWTNMFGEKLHFLDLVEYELEQPIKEAACGGTHRLFGLTWALHLHMRAGGKIEGTWAKVAAKLDKYKMFAREYQNPDGSFSSQYVSGPGYIPDLDRRINTTGHVLEWLALVLNDEEIHMPWVGNAANALCVMILSGQGQLLDAGSLYHAGHGLRLYHRRVYGKSSGHHSPLLPLLDD